MTEAFDINKMTAEFVQQNAESFLKISASGLRRFSSQFRGRLASSFSNYVSRILDRYGRGKSFFVRNESTPLYDFFVPLDLSAQSRTLKEANAESLFTASRCVIITGSGGSGKSMMMRHLLVSCVRDKLKVPVFLELRQLNQSTDSVRAAITSSLISFGLSADDDFLESGLKAGHFLLLFDGYDELERSVRRRVATDIRRLAERYPETWIVMSSRPDDSLAGWEEFSEYSVDPLSLESAVSLVERLHFDEPVKRQFIRDMQSRLFVEHQSFLSNPLLLSIMLLTYSDIAHIPHKISTFYSQAYEALFHRHDALKSGFQRERRCALDIQDFSRAFSAFSLLSYESREFAFSRERALELIEDAREASMLEFDATCFLDDAIQANCLLIEEGLNIVFAHRSFQEYFVAKYICTAPSEVSGKLVRRYAPVLRTDQVMALLWEMNPYIVEKHYLLPTLARVREGVGDAKTLTKTHLRRYLALLFEAFHLRRSDEDDSSSVTATSKQEKLSSLAPFIMGRYRPQIRQFLTDEEFESPRDSRRLHFVRRWSHGKRHTVLPRGA